MEMSSPISFCSLVGGIRLDRFLAEALTDTSRSYLQKLITQGKVWINHQVCSDKHRLIHPQDTITIDFPPTQSYALTPQPLPLDLLYEDTEIIVVNKPAGLVVHPAVGHQDTTLVHALLFHCDQLSGINGIERPGIVHRLDKDTSGVMVVAKTDRAHQSIQLQIQAKTARRCYLGIVAGIPKTAGGTITTYIGRHPHDRQKMAVLPQGRIAITHWQLLAQGKQSALLQFDLETGRTHQIRVHCAYMGHGIINDPLYGKPHATPYLPGQALHAWQLQLQHPTTGEQMTFTAPLSEGFQGLLRHLQLPTSFGAQSRATSSLLL